MILKKVPLELCVWTGALILLSLSYPRTEGHFSICPLHLSGFSWCPGCGLGRSVSYLLHGEIRLSVSQHWLGIPAFLILINRIFQLFNKFILFLLKSKTINYGK